jgi:hypothetical protein
MAVRLEVLEDGTIQMIRTNEGRAKILQFDSLDKTIEIARYLLKRDECEAKQVRFKPQFAVECRKLMKQMIKEKR